MSSKFDLKRLKNDNNFYKAYEILQNIINHNCPDIKLLTGLYGYDKALTIRNLIEHFLSNAGTYIQVPRKHIRNASSEIYKARSEIESNAVFQKIHSSLLLNKLPDIKDLKFFYGSYSEYIIRIFGLYLEKGLKRKCELSATAHLNRVGTVVFQMGMNDPGSFKYSAISVLHDSIEDLLNLTFVENGKGTGILNYKKFLNEFIPEDLQSSIKILTNHYDLILEFIVEKLKSEDKSINRKNILNIIKYLLDLKPSEISYYIQRMPYLIENMDSNNDDNLIVTIKWEFYKNLYLDNIAASSSSANDFRLFEIKGVDLSDNSHGKDALSIESKIKNILKNTLWGKKGYSLHSTWIPLNKHIEEIIEDSLYGAENIILKDLLEVQSCIDFVMSALIKFRKLEPIFYN